MSSMTLLPSSRTRLNKWFTLWTTSHYSSSLQLVVHHFVYSGGHLDPTTDVANEILMTTKNCAIPRVNFLLVFGKC